MKVKCLNIGPAEFGGQLEWEGTGDLYTIEVDQMLKTAYNQDGSTRSRVEDGHIFVYEVTDDDRRAIASRQILKFYPEWKQLNILRTGSTEEQNIMATFIDACRAWSNDPSNEDPFGLDSLIP
jgi:hypothetical protein